jgi:hypothetical protein
MAVLMAARVEIAIPAMVLLTVLRVVRRMPCGRLQTMASNGKSRIKIIQKERSNI